MVLSGDPEWDYFRLTFGPPNRDVSHVPGGLYDIPSGVSLHCPELGVFDGDSEWPVMLTCLDADSSWGGIYFPADIDAGEVQMDYCEISFADFGVYALSVGSTLGDRMEIDHCTFDSCGVGVYANNSRLSLTYSTITNSYTGTYGGSGIYLTTCSAGQVEIDSCRVIDNGIDGTIYSPGVFLYDADPEITRTEITGNGCGICAYASSPDLNTYDFTGYSTRHNDIHENGGSTQSGSDGAEIFLSWYSSPVVKYNNIYDFGTSSPNGYALYNDLYNVMSITAKNNWWGTSYPGSYESSLFCQDGGQVTYSPYESSAIVDDGEEDPFEIAMIHWDRDEFADAAELLAETASDTGVVGVNSIRYLVGCEGEIENGNYLQLREWLQDLSEEHRDPRVAKVAQRFATHCLTLNGDYENAMEEYDHARENAECLQDSVMAALDWLAVYELASGNEVNAAGESVMQRRQHLISMMKDREAMENRRALPSEYAISEVYPNPFNSTVRISFALREAGDVKLSICDLNGRLIQTLLEFECAAGTHTAMWDASSMPSGLYLARLKCNGHPAMRKLTLIK